MAIIHRIDSSENPYLIGHGPYALHWTEADGTKRIKESYQSLDDTIAAAGRIADAIGTVVAVWEQMGAPMAKVEPSR